MHVLHNEVSCAEINEAHALVTVRENGSQQLHHLVLAIVLVNQLLLGLQQLKALVELLSAKLAAHILLELVEVARRNVDHVLLGSTLFF